MVKDITVIYRKNETILVLISLDTLFFQYLTYVLLNFKDKDTLWF